jgi:hypothetical protein
MRGRRHYPKPSGEDGHPDRSGHFPTSPCYPVCRVTMDVRFPVLLFESPTFIYGDHTVCCSCLSSIQRRHGWFAHSFLVGRLQYPSQETYAQSISILHISKTAIDEGFFGFFFDLEAKKNAPSRRGYKKSISDRSKKKFILSWCS